MAAPRLSPAKMLAAVNTLAASGGDYNRAAAALRIPVETLRSQVKRAQAEGLKPGMSAPDVVIPPPPPPARPPEHKDMLRLRRLEGSSAAQTKRIAELESLLNADEDYRAAVFGLVAQPIARKPIALPPAGERSAIDIPVLITSDFQYGERVRADEMDGLNEYSPAIAQRRYRYLIEAAGSLISEHVVRPAYPAIYYIRGGDAISGRIHDELAETNSLSDPECVRDLVGMESDGLAALYRAALKATKQRSIKVRVPSIPGNHGRTTKKPRAKGYVRSNLETLIAWDIEREFKNCSDFEFITPMSGDVYEKIYDTPFAITHGDRIGSRGGTGFIGAAATIMRGIHKTRQQYAGVGKPVRYVILGHFHDGMWLPHAIVNNNLCGFNEYARDLRFEAAPPSQSLFFVHPKWGVTTRREIILEEKTADGRAWNNLAVAA